MKIAIVSRDAGAVRLVRTMLVHAMHTVDVYEDAELALRAFGMELPDCILVDWLLPGIDGIELARRVKAKAVVPVIVMSDLSQHQARSHALRAGAVSYLVKPLVPQCVVSAILAVRKASSVQRIGVLRSVIEERFVKTPIWTRYPSMATEWLRSSTGLALSQAAEPTFVPSDDDHVASLAMVDVATSIEVSFSIRASRASAAVLAMSMLGVTALDDDSAVDLLGELCNNLLGQAKTNLRSADFDFSLATYDHSRPQTPPPGVSAQREVELWWGGDAMLVTMSVRTLPASLVRAKDLVENMVVVEDIRSQQGALLVPAGTRLTAVVAERVMRHLEGREVRVAKVGT